jgi:hypothetical protein
MPTLSTPRAGVDSFGTFDGAARSAARVGVAAPTPVIERPTSWFNRCRGLPVRREKKQHNYLALVQFSAALPVWRVVG